MKKIHLSKWMFVAIAMLCMLPLSAGKIKFTAVTANVDGLPPVVHIDYKVFGVSAYKKDITMNEDGSQEPGATRMGQLIAENLWDIVALSEDFNYHSYIMEGVSQYYNAGEWRGLIDQSNLNGNIPDALNATPTDNKGVYMKTDGLGFLTRKKYSVSPTSEGKGTNWVSWNQHYGFDKNEADGLIDKGFRFYQVTLAPGYVVDVYITHMEAGSDPEDNAARATQLVQFAEYIKAHKGENPIIILGDTNCRYTRDPLKTGFIDLIEQDEDLKVSDPWVDLMWDGVYPEFGTGSIMTSQYGQQKGEVVDKVFYINNAKSVNKLTCEKYLHDDSFTYADGSQIADHYPVVATLVIEGPADIPGKATFQYPDPTEKKGVVSGQIYFLRNVGSGEFLRAGGAWTTQAVMGDYPSKVIPTDKGDNKYSLKTTHDNKWLRYDGSNYFMDQDENESTLTQVKDNVYNLTDASGNAVTYANGGVAKADAANAADPNQQWEFLTQENLIEELYYATSDSPKDATFLMKAPDFGFADQEAISGNSNAANGWVNSGNKSITIWGSTTTYAIQEKIRPEGFNHLSFWKAYNPSGSSSSNRLWQISQTISGLPAGTYEVTYQAATYNMSDNQTFTINGIVASCTDLGSSDPGNATVAQNLAAGLYANKVIVTVSNEGTYANKIEIKVDKKATKSATGSYFDNFKIKCIGIEGKPDMTVLDRVKKAIDDAQAKADAAGLKGYRNNKVVELWREQEINGDGWNEVKDTYKNLAEAVLAQQNIPADFTYAVVNNSFELFPEYSDSRYNIDGGFPLGWDYNSSYDKDSGVWRADDANKKTNNADGDYIFNAYPNGYAVKQSVILTPGIYTLSAKVASDADNTIYMYAYGKTASGTEFAKKTASVKTTGSDKFETATMTFSVTRGQPFEIAISGAPSRTGTIPTGGGKWFKADDFRLTRIANEEAMKGMEFLQLAINDVKEKSKKYGDELDLSKYQAMLDNYTLVGNGKKEVDEIYTLLAERIRANADDPNNIDYTDLIINNSFEWGNTYGWEYEKLHSEADAQNESRFNFTGKDGDWIFNNWTDVGVPGEIVQTLPTLPVGHYELKAVLACDQGQSMLLGVRNADGNYIFREDFVAPSAKDVGNDRTLVFDLFEQIPGLMIAAGGSNGNWYKVDNFRLYFKGLPQACAAYKDLQKAIDYANAQAAKLPEKYASKWSATEFQAYVDEHCSDDHDHANGAHSEKDPLNHDATEQIKAVYAKLNTLIFSQTEPEADFTAAIVNPSFETGDLTGWTTKMNGGADTRVTSGHEDNDYLCKGVDGTYLLNNWQWPDEARPVYQVIPNAAPGRYKLTLKLASFLNNKFFIGANYQHSDIITIPELTDEERAAMTEINANRVEEKYRFIDCEFVFEIPGEDADKDLKIGLYPTLQTDATNITEFDFDEMVTGPWYKVDDFRLVRNGIEKEIEWQMEGQNYGSIVMPFDAEVPEGYIAYRITGFGNVTPMIDQDLGGTYQLINIEAVEVLEAHKAYLIMKADAGEEEPARLRNAEPDAVEPEPTPSLTFSGLHETNGNPAAGTMLAGTYEERQAAEGEYHFNAELKGFKKATADNLPTVAAHHAYVPAESGAAADYLFLTETDVPTAVAEIFADDANADVYTVGGVLVRSNVNAADALRGLDPGLYIIRAGNRTLKVFKK